MLTNLEKITRRVVRGLDTGFSVSIDLAFDAALRLTFAGAEPVLVERCVMVPFLGAFLGAVAALESNQSSTWRVQTRHDASAPWLRITTRVGQPLAAVELRQGVPGPGGIVQPVAPYATLVDAPTLDKAGESVWQYFNKREGVVPGAGR